MGRTRFDWTNMVFGHNCIPKDAPMDKPTTEREPLLEVCREAARQVCRDQWCEGGSQLTLAMDVADGIAKVIQAKITSGELVVRHKCKKCGNLWTPSFITKSRCPGCGNPIT